MIDHRLVTSHPLDGQAEEETHTVARKRTYRGPVFCRWVCSVALSVIELHRVPAEVIKAARKFNGEWVRPLPPLSSHQALISI